MGYQWSRSIEPSPAKQSWNGPYENHQSNNHQQCVAHNKPWSTLFISIDFLFPIEKWPNPHGILCDQIYQLIPLPNKHPRKHFGDAGATKVSIIVRNLPTPIDQDERGMTLWVHNPPLVVWNNVRWSGTFDMWSNSVFHSHFLPHWGISSKFI